MVNSRQRPMGDRDYREKKSKAPKKLCAGICKTCGAVNILSKTLAISNEEDGDSETIPAPCP